MKVTINEGCLGCGICEGTCSSVFSINFEGRAEVEKQPEQSELSQVRDAVELCPAQIIELSKW
jgi:ferredoxin